jgi:hypothetical protein
LAKYAGLVGTVAKGLIIFSSLFHVAVTCEVGHWQAGFVEEFA